MEEIGLGFLVGALAGAIIVVIVTVIVYASRRAASSGKARQKAAPEPPPAAAQGPGAGSGASARAIGQISGRHTIVVDVMESRDQQFNKNIVEIRNLLLHLADVVGSTESASGEATRAFNSAKDAIYNIDSAESPDLAEAQRLLVDEIERVLQSNVKLHCELDRANRGIAEQRRQIEELRVQARVDSLTRIPNRAAFDERLNEYIGLLRRSKLVFTLMLMDIDLFKNVNDQHGHINGDRILRGVAARLTDSIRSNDFAARYGGEEFAVIFPGTELREALLVAERIRQDIAKTAFRMDEQIVKVTVSGGLAECRRSMGPENILSAADGALYRAKEEGRNRIVVVDDAAAEPD